MCSVSILLRMSYFFKSGVIISVRMGNIQNSLSYSVGKPYRSMKVGVEPWRFGSFWMTLDCLYISDKLSLHLFQLWERRTGIREYRSQEVMVLRKNGAHEGETHPVLSCKIASKRLLALCFRVDIVKTLNGTHQKSLPSFRFSIIANHAPSWQHGRRGQ